MHSLITGESVTVIRPRGERDGLGEPVYAEPERVALTDVLVFPGSSADLDESRPDGVRVTYTLHFPKDYNEPLRGCSVVVRGEVLRVVGDPAPYTASNTPGPWNYTVEVERSDG